MQNLLLGNSPRVFCPIFPKLVSNCSVEFLFQKLWKLFFFVCTWKELDRPLQSWGGLLSFLHGHQWEAELSSEICFSGTESESEWAEMYSACLSSFVKVSLIKNNMVVIGNSPVVHHRSVDCLARCFEGLEYMPIDWILNTRGHDVIVFHKFSLLYVYTETRTASFSKINHQTA